MRKKYLVVFLAIILISVGFLTVSHQSFAEDYSVHYPLTSNANEVLSAAKVEEKLKEFIGSEEDNRHDRTTFSEAERSAATWLNDKLIGYGLDSKILNFEIQGNKSQNVEVRIKSKAENAKQVIIGASYDNNYNEIKISGATLSFPAKKSQGVLDNGTSVAVVLALAEYYADADLPFDLVFSLFGASQVGIRGGSMNYVSEMGNTARANTLAMFSLGRIGADYLYSYYDEVATQHGEFVDGIASARKVSLEKLPWYKPISPQFYSESVPYSHYGLLYDNVPFLDSNVNTVAIFGGNFNQMKLSNSESAKDNIVGTNLDNLAGVAAAFPQYAEKMSQAASVIVGTIESPQMASVFAASANSTFNYSLFTNKIIANFINLFLIIVCAIVLIIFINKFSKIEKPKAKNVKLTVFGTDYEDGSKEDYIDFMLKPLDESKKDHNPFDGY